MKLKKKKKNRRKSKYKVLYLIAVLLLDLLLNSAVSAKHLCSVRQRLLDLTDLFSPRGQVFKTRNRLGKQQLSNINDIQDFFAAVQRTKEHG